MAGEIQIRSRLLSLLTCFLIGAAIPLTSLTVGAQELVPVNSRKAIGWGVSTGELPVPINPQQEEQGQITAEQRGELPPYTGGPTRQADVIVQRYPDGKPQVTRHVMQDEGGNFLNHGPWKLLNRRGEIMAEGEFQQGRMNGSWQRWHPSNSPGLFTEPPFDTYQGPFLSTAEFKNGTLDGVWTIYDRFRRKIIELPYRNGKRNGRAAWYYSNSLPMREVDFLDGQVHGQMIEYNRQGEKTREATFDDGQELITRTAFYFKDQKKAETGFLGPRSHFVNEDDWWNAEPAQYETQGEELQHGPTREWYVNGQLRLAGQYKDGLQIGSFMWWHANGQKQIEGQFENGTKVGLWSWYHGNGQKAIEGVYDRDVETGVWRWWNESGELDDERDYSRESLEIDNLENLDAPPEDGAGNRDT